jgi:mevalonate kinase
LHCGGNEPLEVEIRSALPSGSGFGSSSAAAVGILAALLVHHGTTPEADLLDRLAMEVERRQHGLPSGVDHRTVIAGGVIWAQREGQGGLTVEPVVLDPERLAAFQVYATGTPFESTGEVVAEVRRRIADDRVRYEAALDEIAAATVELRGALDGPLGDPGAIRAALRRCTRGLEELGVVPEAVQSRIRRIEAEGGAAKISGAGALSGTGAGCLLVYPPPGGQELSGVAGLAVHRVRLGGHGLREEDCG